jgi:cytochrome c-type biogenesis protein CcmH/NrfF
MEWLLFESLIALLVAVGIVWWTMSARRKDAPPAAPDGQDDQRQ